MHVPQVGDILIRNLLIDSFELVDVVTLRFVGGPYPGFRAAVDAARVRKARAIWSQNIDARGRALGDPVRLPEF